MNRRPKWLAVVEVATGHRFEKEPRLGNVYGCKLCSRLFVEGDLKYIRFPGVTIPCPIARAADEALERKLKALGQARARKAGG